MANVGGLDQNSRRTLSALSSVDNTTIVNLWADPTTHRLLVDLSGGGDITIGTSTITNGTNGKILYDNNGVVGELTNNFLTSLAGAVLTDQTVGQTIGTTGARLTKLWATDITCTNAIAGSITGNSATSTTAPTTAVLISQTSGQTIGDTTNRLTKLWATDITVTNAITGSVTGNAGTVTGLSFASGKTLTVNNILTLAGTDSTTMTFPSTSASIARTDAAQTFTGIQTIPQILCVENAQTASANAITFDRTNRINKVTNNSASGLTITLSTTGATAGDMIIVKSVPSSAVAQTITWVNTENSDVTPSANLNASTTSPRTDGFMWNSLTSKWRCVASC